MRAVVDREAERNALGVHPAVTMPTLGRPRRLEAGDALDSYDMAVARRWWRAEVDFPTWP